MKRQTDSWVDTFTTHIGSHDLVGAIACLDRLKTPHACTPPQAIKDRAVRLLRKTYAAEPDRLYETGLALLKMDNAGAKEIGIYILPPFYEVATAVIDEQFVQTGDDTNWEVREWAASALSYVITAHFERVHTRLEAWASHPSENVRRMVVVASGYATRDCPEPHSQKLLTLLAPLMADRSAYVSKNLGPFALGSYALRYRTKAVAAWAIDLDLSDEQTA